MVILPPHYPQKAQYPLDCCSSPMKRFQLVSFSSAGYGELFFVQLGARGGRRRGRGEEGKRGEEESCFWRSGFRKSRPKAGIPASKIVIP